MTTPPPSGSGWPNPLARSSEPGAQSAHAPEVTGPDLADEHLVSGHTAPEEVLADLVAPGEHVIDTSGRKANGFDKCPRCGSTDMGYSLSEKALVCRYCRFQWNEEKAETAFGFDSPIEQLRGTVRGTGTQDIAVDDTVVTLKCQGCGAEVVIKTDESLQARCHWCRQTLSINQQIPNGAVPDAVLPFTLSHAEGVEAVRTFVGSRRFFATREFKAQFRPENVVGVYMPYMLVDGNLHAMVEGTGERTLRRYQRQVSKDRSITVSDIEISQLGRRFDFTVDDLITESSSERANMNTSVNTNNVLNAILPFDTKNAVAYNSNYLSGFSSEKRDLDIDDVDEAVESNFLSIARSRADQMIQPYDRGVRWSREGVQIVGTRWVAIYLPVWLYSYQDPATRMVHYIAVNARNGRTMGSVPVSHLKLTGCAIALGITTTLVTLPFAIAGVFMR